MLFSGRGVLQQLILIPGILLALDLLTVLTIRQYSDRQYLLLVKWTIVVK